ncbi:MAG: hypothetical protein ACFFCI_20010 [Promethearchaeota archaeon]
MNEKTKSFLEIELVSCPFIKICIIPKNEFCELPMCKLCSEYVLICQRLNPNYLF